MDLSTNTPSSQKLFKTIRTITHFACLLGFLRNWPIKPRPHSTLLLSWSVSSSSADNAGCSSGDYAITARVVDARSGAQRRLADCPTCVECRPASASFIVATVRLRQRVTPYCFDCDIDLRLLLAVKVRRVFWMMFVVHNYCIAKKQ